MKDQIKQLQQQLAKQVMENQKMKRDYKEARNLLDRCMEFGKHVGSLSRDYNTLVEREKLGLRG